ncbi:50S ribosomal protein L5 [Candidatus Curtissbacteria bacterium RIFCSPLOWO2_01_FULL_38_11b]|uniref:Large ribosomal subunit protein uL5 n=1 Tax=Candidatus Curtissbacteria bacterium RIFCSPLOWO2_01_FULL_38_11b TaxID=1797725 RepID=A0A1F5H017_9BACT|nr:MAG: 50S ribosomal protein L5 [Candidatus Curtissbacteria bacterium RIFCSPLOWO2_01_FULL_38_11b]
MNKISKKYYKDEVSPKLKEEFKIKNDLSLPFLEKIVLNASVVDSFSDKAVLEKVKNQMADISGQMPKITLAKKSISSFKLKQNDPIGVMVTLRGKKSWNFLESFISLVAPRMRDFRGMPDDKFDEKGNYSFGVAEQILFPQIDYSKIDKPRGLVVTLVIQKSDKQKSKRMLELLGLPFRKENI